MPKNRVDIPVTKYRGDCPADAVAMTRMISPLIDQLIADRTPSLTLAILRDTLLPKLLSGELSVAAVSATMEATV